MPERAMYIKNKRGRVVDVPEGLGLELIKNGGATLATRKEWLVVIKNNPKNKYKFSYSDKDEKDVQRMRENIINTKKGIEWVNLG